MSSLLYSFDILKKYEQNACIIWKESLTKERIYSYHDVIQAAQQFLTTLGDLHVIENSKILVNIGHSSILLSVILGILNKPCCYCPINVNENVILECLDEYKTKYLICDSEMKSISRYESVTIHNILGINVYIYIFKNNSNPIYIYDDVLCYAVKTSGSTGDPKIVHVPYKCIVHNIVSLSQLFKVQAKDVLFISSPPTFDPFIVDIFLAFLSGASTLFVPTALRLAPNILAPMIFRSDSRNATISQVTPSLFRRFDSEMLKDYVFHECTSLRILVFGGEPFPSHEEFKKWPIWQNPKRVQLFNIYGITEVSCWASIVEISHETINVSLGQPLDEHTKLIVRTVNNTKEIADNGLGELFIESSKRKCFISPEVPDILTDNSILSRKTGDLVEKRGCDIFYKSRTDSIVKRFGCKINLKIIEDKIKTLYSSIHGVHCVYDSKQSLLLAFIKLSEYSAEPDSLYKSFETLEKPEVPDDVIYIEKFPLSCHGKISKQKLIKYYESIRGERAFGDISKAKNVMKIKLKEYLGFDLDHNTEHSNEPEEKRARRDLWEEKSFLDIGGSSFIALRIVTELEDIMCQSLGSIFIKLLDPNYCLKQILDDLKVCAESKPIIQTPIKLSGANFHLNIVWKYNLHKCIDASPTLIRKENQKTIVAIGSHSHKLAGLDVDTGNQIFALELPDRIESQIVISGDHGIVGCYDGLLYKFAIKTGEIIQKYNSGGMIKCRPLLIENYVVFGNYSEAENVFCLDATTFEKSWSTRVGSKSCFASPVIYSNDKVILCTLDGLIACLNYRTGSTKWELKLDTPIFSTPAIISGETIAVAEVCGKIHCIKNAVKECTYDVSANVFSSLVAIDKSTFIFGCYDHKIYFLQYINEEKILILLRSVQLDSQIYAAASVLELRNITYIVACTTKGKVTLIDTEKSKISASIDLGGEIFSSPVIEDNKIFVGCRNNYLYCIDVN